MFDLFKDIDKYKGIPPYASELYGVYQPLLGWESRMTKQWLQKAGPMIDPQIKVILDQNIKPGPEKINPDDIWEMLAEPLQPGSGLSPYRVLLAKDLKSELLKLIQDKVQKFVDAHNGQLPSGSEWLTIIDFNNLMDKVHGDLRKVNDIHRRRLYEEAILRAPERHLTEAMVDEIKKTHLELMQYESQIATFLVFHAEGQSGYNQNDLNKLFQVKKVPPLSDILRPTDPLAGIDPRDDRGALSPIGIVHLFRQYFFNLGTFLGEPVEHVWLAPGTTIEMYETSTRKTTIERSTETYSETTTSSESELKRQDEISEAVKEENSNSTKLGISQNNTVNTGVYQGSVSANFGLESTRKNTRETIHKQNREQTEKVSSQIKQSFKSTFRMVTETTDTTSRRHIIANPSPNLVNYELRRKMRRVGVQLQDIGTRLCWQVFVDDPGTTLGLSELVHIAQSPDLSTLKEPDKIPDPTTITKKWVVPFPFKPVLNYYNNRAQYEYQGHAGGDTNNPQLGIIVGDEDDDDSQIVIEQSFKVDVPSGYDFKTDDIRMTGVQGGKIAILRAAEAKSDGTINIILQRVAFGGENVVNLEFDLFFTPTPDEIKRVNDLNANAKTNYDAEKNRLAYKTYLEEIRKRIKDASAINKRPSWDLREEERTVVYRKLIELLMIDSWRQPDNRKLSHIRSEVIRSIFDVDSMMYFVAPEWWMPRLHPSHHDLNKITEDYMKPLQLTDKNIVSWGGEDRPANYMITEDSAPAPLGSSLGWLLQLDGDNLRNAFLNAPWVKAVIPIRPGRENAALNWLKSIEGHDQDGWDTSYLGTEPEFQGMKMGEVLKIIADRLQQQNEDIQNVLATEKVFEHGFDHLKGGFDAGLDANEVFSQWISVLPTDQIVAVEYHPNDLNS
ncbi:hypothetical protein [Neobacillus drentensis]|uniref:hypothetical protein n=1 Tax=Neobacillus drentensis TaxID=220684 RepID=UPI00300369DF